MNSRIFSLADETETEKLGQKLAKVLSSRICIFLEGDLGAGKTTFTRGLIRAMGYTGIVKSPTYTLVESYEFDACSVYHFDLYRLADPEELEYIGVRDYFNDKSVVVVEWPDKGDGVLPEPDLVITINYEKESSGRIAEIKANSEQGNIVIGRLG